MNKIKFLIPLILIFLSSCALPTLQQNDNISLVPDKFPTSKDSVNSAKMNWKEFFQDKYLVNLIDSALINNQELNIIAQEILISKNEIMARRGEYLPTVNIGGGLGAEKVGRYTSQGANDANTDIAHGKEFPEPLGDFLLSANASWELDVWRKLRNAKDASVKRYLSSIEGKNFIQTQLIAEIANSYYELLSLDNQLEILNSNINIQQDALNIVRIQKQAGKVTELAVKKYEAEVLKNRSLIFNIKQQITETENKINFLVGRFPQKIERDHLIFNTFTPQEVLVGLPSQLLENRPDIRQAELQIEAAKLDVKSTKANFYPAFRINAGLGFQAFNPSYFFQTPESMLYSLAGDFVAPLVNRNAIKAQYLTANSIQIQAMYDYERTIINAYIEVLNQVSNISNLQSSFELKEKQVEALINSIEISSNLFKSARADYMEVMLTQRDALEARFELVETKKQQFHSMVDLYRSLGGGW